jgi:hypothetical protein
MHGKIKQMRDEIMKKREVIPEEEKESPSMETVIFIINVLIISTRSNISKICRKKHTN